MSMKELADEFMFSCECRKLSVQTIHNYRLTLGYLLDYLEHEESTTELEQVTPQMIRHYLMSMQKKGRKPQYINDLLKVHKCFFKWAFDEGYIDTVITDKVKNVKEPKVIIQTFTEDEVARMVKYYDGHDFLSVRNKAMMAMMFDTGIRLNELVTLAEEDIYRDYILIKNGKGGKERVVPKSSYLAKCLFKYLQVKQGFFADGVIKYNNLFLSKNGKPLTHELVERVVRNAGIACNVDSTIRCSPHTCRHTFAQMQLKNGLDIYALERIMGHESIAITQRYLEGIRDKDVIIAGNKTSPLMNLK